MIYTLGTKLHFNVGKVVIDKMIENHIIEQTKKCIEKKRIAAFERSLIVNQNQGEGKLGEESEKLIEKQPNEEGKVVERKLYEDGKKNEKNEANACGDNQTGDNLPADNLTGNILPGYNLTGDNLPDDDDLSAVNLNSDNLPADNLTGENLTDAQLIGLFVDDFHQPYLANEFITSVEALSADRFSSKVTFSLTDNTVFEEAEDLYEELMEYRRSEYLYVEARLTAGEVVRKKLRGFGKAIRRVFKWKNWRKVFGRRKAATVIADNI